MGPSSSEAISMFDRMMFSACEDCVFGVSDSETSDMAARTSGGRLVEVRVINSSRMLERNCISFILDVVLVLPADFRDQLAGQRAGLPGVLISRLVAIRHRHRRRYLLERERADPHPWIERDRHTAEVAQLERGLANPAR